MDVSRQGRLLRVRKTVNTRQVLRHLGAWRVLVCLATMSTARGQQELPADFRDIAIVYLTPRASESAGFERSAYLLLKPPTDSESRTGAEWAVSVLQREARLSSGSGVHRPPNVVYLLVREVPPKDAGPKWFVEHYDYERAARLRERAVPTATGRQVLAISEVPLLGGGPVDPAKLKTYELRMPIRPESTPPQETRSAPPHDLTGRDFLLPRNPEGAGYGLYSYLLLGEKVNAINRQLYEAIIGAYLDLGEVQRFETSGKDRKQLNVTYVPLTDAPPPNLNVGWVLDHYDHVAAQVLLGKAMPRGNLSGAFIISYDKPVSGAAEIDRQRLLVQDLSGVPPDLAFLWFREFKQQVRQSRYWDQRTMGEFMLKMRTQIAEIARAFGGDSRTLVATQIVMGH